MSLVELDDVTFAYPSGTEALRGVTLRIDAGERVAVIGQNGAGKTTLAKLLNGLLRPATGTVRVAGVDNASRTAAATAHVVGYVFQNPDDQIFHSTVSAEIAYGLRRTGVEEAERERRVAEAAALCGLTDVLEENPYDLPLSVRKLVTVALVIALDPDVVVLDEPTAGQDLAGLTRLAAIADELARRGKAVLVITHDMEFAAAHAGRIVVMAQGLPVTDGPPSEVFHDAEAMAAARLRPPVVADLAAHLGIPEIGLDVDALAAWLRRTARR